jgi:hypothetical protein
MFSQITIDLNFVGSIVRYGVAAFLVAICVFTFVIPWLRSSSAFKLVTASEPAKANKPFERKDSSRSSDTPPPEGFADHIEIIEAAAPNAGPVVWWEYAKAEMTEAEVALAEAKLANHNKTE